MARMRFTFLAKQARELGCQTRVAVGDDDWHAQDRRGWRGKTRLVGERPQSTELGLIDVHAFDWLRHPVAGPNYREVSSGDSVWVVWSIKWRKTDLADRIRTRHGHRM